MRECYDDVQTKYHHGIAEFHLATRPRRVHYTNRLSRSVYALSRVITLAELNELAVLSLNAVKD